MKRNLLALWVLVFAGCAAGPQQFMQSIADAKPANTESPDFDVEMTSPSQKEGK